MGFGPPGRYDVPFARLAISVDHCHLYAIYKSDRVNPFLAIVETIIRSFDCRSIEDSRGILKSDSVTTNVDNILVTVPGESHS
jgi:hypothetical protein